MQVGQDRRRFLGALTSLGAASLVGARSTAQEAPPETTALRIAKIAGICISPQYVADALLGAEGFTDIQYVATDAGIPAALSVARGEVDFTANFAPTFIIPIDRGEPITIIGGERVPCEGAGGEDDGRGRRGLGDGLHDARLEGHARVGAEALGDGLRDLLDPRLSRQP